jgi:hypothetical protein
MKTTQIYLVGIALLMYVSYARHHDEYRQKQQAAQIHREFCASMTFHPDCKR